MISFDQIDLILLDELQRDSKQSVKELAKKVKYMSVSRNWKR